MLSAKLEGGSGNFSYEWTVVHCSNMTEAAIVYATTNYNTKDINFSVSNATKVVKITCKVFDNVLDKNKENPVTDFKVLF